VQFFKNMQKINENITKSEFQKLIGKYFCQFMNDATYPWERELAIENIAMVMEDNLCVLFKIQGE